MPSSDFVDFIYRASRIRLGQSAKALVWRWRQICPLKIDIFTLSAPNSTNKVSMFKLAIEVCFENHFGLIHAIFLSLGSTKSGYFLLGHPVDVTAFHQKGTVSTAAMRSKAVKNFYPYYIIDCRHKAFLEPYDFLEYNFK